MGRTGERTLATGCTGSGVYPWTRTSDSELETYRPEGTGVPTAHAGYTVEGEAGFPDHSDRCFCGPGQVTEPAEQEAAA